MKMYRILAKTLVLLLFLSSCNGDSNNPKKQERVKIHETDFQGIEGSVKDAVTAEAISARIVIEDSKGEITDSYYDHLPGFFTDENGTFQIALKPDVYKISCYHGIDYQSQEVEVIVESGKGHTLTFNLMPWTELKTNGWVNGNGHCHLYTQEIKNDSMLALVRQINLAQGVDFICTAQGWAGYTDSTWIEGYKNFTDDRFHLYYGSEMPKYRTGHTWWIGQESTRDYFWRTMDMNYEEKYFQSEIAEEWNFDELKFEYIPDAEIIPRIKDLDNAVAIMPHPTSWWWQQRGNISKFTSNISSYLSYGLLAGKLWDGLVVMGYDHDHYIYQQLWFNVLNQGYRMPAIAELDGGLNRNDRFYYGSMRTYFHIDGDFKIDKVVDAVKRGETFITSGPIILADVDSRYKIGEIVPANKRVHKLNIKAFASGELADYLSYVIVFRNGEIYKYWDLRESKLREFQETLNIKEQEQAWYVIKVYGKNAWDDPENLDVLSVANKLFFDSIPPFQKGQHDIAMTSPFYFWPEGTKDPGVMVSEVDLRLVNEEGELINDAGIDILVNAKIIKSERLINGKANFSMPVDGLLKIQVNNDDPIYRGLYMDYKPHLALLENLSSGRWINDYKPEGYFSAGEVPWEAFNFEKTKEVLSKVDWEIVYKENERDTLYEEFFTIFSGSK